MTDVVIDVNDAVDAVVRLVYFVFATITASHRYPPSAIHRASCLVHTHRQRARSASISDVVLSTCGMIHVMGETTRERCRTNTECCTVKLASKARDGSKWVRKHGKPATPAQRLLDHPGIPKTVKNKLRRQTDSLNPFELQRQIRRKLKATFNLVR